MAKQYSEVQELKTLIVLYRKQGYYGLADEARKKLKEIYKERQIKGQPGKP